MDQPDCPEDWKLITTGNGNRKKKADANKDGFVCRENINENTEVKPNGKYIRNFRDNNNG